MSFYKYSGLSDTLFLWRCVVQLLQSEEQIVRDTAVGVIRLALSQENTLKKTGKKLFSRDQ